MKRVFFFVGLLFLVGCFEVSNRTEAQFISELYLDSLYNPKIVKNKYSVGFIKITNYLDSSKKDYRNRSERRLFTSIIDSNYTLTNDKIAFPEKVNNILSKKEQGYKGYIILEIYKVSGTKYTSAFFVDSACEKVFAKVNL